MTVLHDAASLSIVLLLATPGLDYAAVTSFQESVLQMSCIQIVKSGEAFLNLSSVNSSI